MLQVVLINQPNNNKNPPIASRRSSHQHGWITQENLTNKNPWKQSVRAPDDKSKDLFPSDALSMSYVKFEPHPTAKLASTDTAPIHMEKETTFGVEHKHDYNYPIFDGLQHEASLGEQRPPPSPLEWTRRRGSSQPATKDPPLPEKKERKRFPKLWPRAPSKKAKTRRGQTPTSSCAEDSVSSVPDSDASQRRLLHHLHVKRRVQCKLCRAMYFEHNNRPGACSDAYDPARRCVETASCLGCAQGVLYHCVSKEANFDEPYSCANSHPDDEEAYSSSRKWCLLTVITLLVPCLWCYCILRPCHRAGVACGCCGGRHQPDDVT